VHVGPAAVDAAVRVLDGPRHLPVEIEEAAGVGLPESSKSRMIWAIRNAESARSAREPWFRYKTGTARQTVSAGL